MEKLPRLMEEAICSAEDAMDVLAFAFSGFPRKPKTLILSSR